VKERSFAVLMWSARLAMFVFGATIAANSVVLKGIEREFSLSFGQLGTIGLVRGLCLGVIVVVGGLLAHRYGKKVLLTAGMLLLGGALLGLCLVGSYPVLLVVFGAVGIGLGLIEALANPLVAELDAARAGRNLNELNAFFAGGMVFGALAGGEFLVRQMDWRAPLLVLAVPALLGGGVFVRTRFPDHRRCDRTEGGLGALLRSRAFWLFGGAMALTAGTEGGITFWSARFVGGQLGASPRAGAIGIAVFAALMTVGRLVAGRATRRVALGGLMIACAALGMGGLVGLMLAGSVELKWCFLGVCGIAVGPFWPTILALADRRVRASSTTLVFALLAAFGIAGYALAAWIIGALADRWGLTASFSPMVAALALAIVMISLTARRRPPAEPSDAK